MWKGRPGGAAFLHWMGGGTAKSTLERDRCCARQLGAICYAYRMKDIVCRPYIFNDRSACLAIFDSNVPTFFAPEERADFCEFLGGINAEDRPYLVLTCQGSVIACGGLNAMTETRQAVLAWGMVERALHGQGLGTRLTRARLALARTMPNISCAEAGYNPAYPWFLRGLWLHRLESHT